MKPFSSLRFVGDQTVFHCAHLLLQRSYALSPNPVSQELQPSFQEGAFVRVELKARHCRIRCRAPNALKEFLWTSHPR